LYKRFDEGMPFLGRTSMVEVLTSNRFYLLGLVTLYFDELLMWRRDWD
jgi:hypothetical protein